jgi:hypothetical protein
MNSQSCERVLINSICTAHANTIQESVYFYILRVVFILFLSTDVKNKFKKIKILFQCISKKKNTLKNNRYCNIKPANNSFKQVKVIFSGAILMLHMVGHEALLCGTQLLTF